MLKQVLIVLLSLNLCLSQLTNNNGKIDFVMTSADTVQITFTGKPNTWMGIALCAKDMNNADMIIVTFKASATDFTVWDAWSTQNGVPPQQDTSQGGQNSLTGSSGASTNGLPTVTVSRKLDTGDPKDCKLTVGTAIKMAMAWGNGNMADHGSNTKTGTFTLTAPAASSGTTGSTIGTPSATTAAPTGTTTTPAPSVATGITSAAPAPSPSSGSAFLNVSGIMIIFSLLVSMI
jgi:hypothetical protein